MASKLGWGKKLPQTLGIRGMWDGKYKHCQGAHRIVSLGKITVSFHKNPLGDWARNLIIYVVLRGHSSYPLRTQPENTASKPSAHATGFNTKINYLCKLTRVCTLNGNQATISSHSWPEASRLLSLPPSRGQQTVGNRRGLSRRLRH